MEIFAIMAIGTLLFVGCQTLFRKIKSAIIMCEKWQKKNKLLTKKYNNTSTVKGI